MSRSLLLFSRWGCLSTREIGNLSSSGGTVTEKDPPQHPFLMISTIASFQSIVSEAFFLRVFWHLKHFSVSLSMFPGVKRGSAV